VACFYAVCRVLELENHVGPEGQLVLERRSVLVEHMVFRHVIANFRPHHQIFQNRILGQGVMVTPR